LEPFFSEFVMLKKTLILGSVLLLGSCAYALDDQIQFVQFLTPGAEDATCNVFIERVHHVVKPPQKVSLSKSRKDMTVDCLAHGNRRQKVIIEPGYEKSKALNVLNGGGGVPWDYASNAMFKYPDIVEVSFVDVPVVPQPLPSQNNLDIRQLEDYPLEEFLPGRPRLNSDSGRIVPEILRRGEGASYNDPSYATKSDDGSDAFSEPAQLGGDKSNLQNAARPASALPKTTTSAPPASYGPLPLLPGE
jgi:hypothetical protein